MWDIIFVEALLRCTVLHPAPFGAFVFSSSGLKLSQSICGGYAIEVSSLRICLPAASYGFGCASWSPDLFHCSRRLGISWKNCIVLNQFAYTLMAVLPVIAIAVKGDRCGVYFWAPGSASGVDFACEKVAAFLEALFIPLL